MQGFLGLKVGGGGCLNLQIRDLQSKYKKCPTSASVLCCDLLYFVLFFSSEERFICKYRNYRF